MKEENKKIKNKYFDEDQDYLTAASATDCTGLIPAAPQNEDEVENYEKIQHFLPPTFGNKSKKIRNSLK